MKKINSPKPAIVSLLALLALVMMFHLLVLAGLIPDTVVWAGKLSSRNEVLVFETISVIINLILFLALLVKGGYILKSYKGSIPIIIILIFAVLFTLNTLGNLFAKTAFELYVFTPLTLISAILCWYIVFNRQRFSDQK